jgi:hypothetical protein
LYSTFASRLAAKGESPVLQDGEGLDGNSESALADERNFFEIEDPARRLQSKVLGRTGLAGGFFLTTET